MGSVADSPILSTYQQKLSTLNNIKKNDHQEMNTAQGTYQTTKVYSAYQQSPRRKREKMCVKKSISRNNGRKLLKFCKTHKPTDLKSSINPMQDKYKETHTQGHHNETT